MFIEVGKKVRVTCAKNCDPCPMKASPVGWKALTEAPCCEEIWIPATYLSQATAKNRTIDRGKAMRMFLRDLGVL